MGLILEQYLDNFIERWTVEGIFAATFLSSGKSISKLEPPETARSSSHTSPLSEVVYIECEAALFKR